MTTRRDGRPSQVRPRPPSSGRPVPVKVRPRATAPGRLTAHHRVERTRRLAFPFRLLFAVAVIALCAGVLFAATGGVGKVAGELGSTFTGFFADLTATPVPSAPPAVLSDTPLIDEPTEPYTNQPTIDLVGSIPTDVIGAPDRQIRIYVALGDQKPGVVTQVPVGRTARFIVPGITLIAGPNAFSATIVGPESESEPSPVVTFIFDAAKPRITLTSPEDGETVNAKSVTLVGLTQSRSAMRVRNASTEFIVTGQADANGNFSIILPIAPGRNDIGITAIDPAGNENHLVLRVQKGSGVLVASLSTSPTRIKLSALRVKVELTVVVSDPNGLPLEGARVTFTLAGENLTAITSKTMETGADGTATWSTNIAKGAQIGSINAAVVVKTTKFGETIDQKEIAIVK